MLVLVIILEPEVTMVRGMLMPRLTPNTLLVTLMLVMALVAILVIPTPVPMDMVTWLDLAMLVLVVLDLAMDTPTLPPLEPAETIFELLSP